MCQITVTVQDHTFAESASGPPRAGPFHRGVQIGPPPPTVSLYQASIVRRPKGLASSSKHLRSFTVPVEPP